MTLRKRHFDSDVYRLASYFAKVIQRKGMQGSLEQIREEILSLLGDPKTDAKLRVCSKSRTTVVRNKAIDLLRREIRWRERHETLSEEFGEVTGGKLSPLDVLGHKEDFHLLNAAIENVARRSSAQGQALVCRLAGLTHIESAELAHCSPAAMRRRLSDAKKQLISEGRRLLRKPLSA